MTGPPMRTAALLTLIGCLTFTAQADAAFVPALESPFPAPAPTQGIAVADADRNGTADVAADGLILRPGDGTGRLGGSTTIGSGGDLDMPIAGDFDGNAWIDYAAIEQGMPDRLHLFTAQPGAAYLASVASEDIGQASSLAAGDVNRDGRLDIVVARAEAGDNLTVLTNSGLGIAPGAVEFAQVDHDTGPDPLESVAVGDFAPGGALEIAVGSSDGAVTLGVATEDPLPGFTLVGSRVPISADPVSGLAPADLDGDGRLDLAAGVSAGVVLLRGAGASGLAPFGPSVATGAGAAASVATGDVNADGRVDVAAGGATGSRVAVLLGDGRGNLGATLGSPFSTGGPVGGEVGAVTIADMNRDDQADLVAANRPGSVSVLLNANTGLMEPFPRSVEFGVVPARSVSTTHFVTLRSLRGRLRISRVANVAGSRAFTVGSGDCLGRTLLVGQSCAVTVGFTAPRRAERLEALLSVDANAAAVIVPLTASVRPPLVTHLRLRPKVLRLRSKAPRPRQKRARRGGRSVSMRLRYRLSEGARVRVKVERERPGRRARNRRCVPPRPANRKRRRCRIWDVVQTIARARQAGPNSMRITPRSPGRPQAVGRYRLSVSASDRFRNRSDEKTRRFRIVRRKSR